MKPLKKEWEHTEIAPQILLQTRNRAWQRLQRRKRQRRLSLAAAGGLAAATALLFLWARAPFGQPAAPVAQVASTNPQAPAAAEPLPPQPEGTALQPVEPHPAPVGEDSAQPVREPVFQRSPAPRDDRQAEAAAAERPAMNPQPGAPALDRLVMNFRLPQSGVRMIWIKQRTPPPSSGGTG